MQFNHFQDSHEICSHHYYSLTAEDFHHPKEKPTPNKQLPPFSPLLLALGSHQVTSHLCVSATLNIFYK